MLMKVIQRRGAVVSGVTGVVFGFRPCTSDLMSAPCAKTNQRETHGRITANAHEGDSEAWRCRKWRDGRGLRFSALHFRSDECPMRQNQSARNARENYG